MSRRGAGAHSESDLNYLRRWVVSDLDLSSIICSALPRFVSAELHSNVIRAEEARWSPVKLAKASPDNSCQYTRNWRAPVSLGMHVPPRSDVAVPAVGSARNSDHEGRLSNPRQVVADITRFLPESLVLTVSSCSASWDAGALGFLPSIPLAPAPR